MTFVNFLSKISPRSLIFSSLWIFEEVKDYDEYFNNWDSIVLGFGFRLPSNKLTWLNHQGLCICWVFKVMANSKTRVQNYFILWLWYLSINTVESSFLKSTFNILVSIVLEIVLFPSLQFISNNFYFTGFTLLKCLQKSRTLTHPNLIWKKSVMQVLQIWRVVRKWKLIVSLVNIAIERFLWNSCWIYTKPITIEIETLNVENAIENFSQR